MKLVALAIFLTSSISHANTCKVWVGPNAELTANRIGDVITSKMLSAQDMKLNDPADTGLELLDFTLDLEAFTEPSAKPYIMMHVSSQKLLNKINGNGSTGKKCNRYSTDLFSSFSFLNHADFRTAELLIQHVPPCDVLKELETNALALLKCI